MKTEIKFPTDEEKKHAIDIIKRWSDTSLSIGNETIGNDLAKIVLNINDIYCLEFADR